MRIYSPGKLMITGEYAVLQGAEAFAIPTKLGQYLEYTELEESNKVIEWTALDHLGKDWLKVTFNSKDLAIVECDNEPQAMALQKLLQIARSLNPAFLQEKCAKVCTILEFDRNWGLGTSSSLIANVAKWAEVDAFTLSEHSFGGSGYDVAVAMVGSELIYSVPPAWDSFVWNAPFKSSLYFVYQNQKQNSRDAVAKVGDKKFSRESLQRITEITRKIAVCKDLDEFQLLITEHEQLISDHLDIPCIKESSFSDYPYAIKSLGAWGGDFIMACGDEKSEEYFKSKGYDTVLNYSEILI